MLRAEFALDVPATLETLTEWQAQPETPPPSLSEMLSFLDRSCEVVQIVGMTGLASFLLRVRMFAEMVAQPSTVFSPAHAPSFTKVASLKWLSAWVEKTVQYMSNPADPAAAEAVAKYVYRCPLKPPTDEVLELAELLSTAPALPLDDLYADPLEMAQDADVALPVADVDTDLLHALLLDAPQQLERLETTMQHWSTGRCTESEMLEAQRIAHTFKGSGNIIGLPGIGRMAHRLEDILEHAFASIHQGQSANPAMVRDTLRAVLCLQQMVAYLQGEEAAPQDAKATLQRLLDWVHLIRTDEVSGAAPEPLGIQAQSITVGAVQLEAPTHVSLSVAQASGLEGGQHAEAASLRVGVDRLSRMLRRAGQSIVQTQRLTQILSGTADRLDAVSHNQQMLIERLRELESLVASQATTLREQQKDGDLDPLELNRYDALHVLSRAITEAVQDDQELLMQVRSGHGQASAVLRDEGYALTEQHRELLAARLVPAKTMLPRLKRNVAQTASTTGKQVAFEIVGDSVSMDSDVLTRLTEPLLHLLRNAVDHGIEKPQERLAQGKAAQGTVVVAFRRVGQEVEITVTDDGRGLDLAAIADKAVEFGLVASGAVLSESELRRLILHPGFSTRDHITEVSGRGVGMDVVNDRITALKGRLAIDSKPLLGCCFTIHVPVSSGVVHALIVQSAQESIALSVDQVLTVLPAGEGELMMRSQQLVLKHDDVSYPAFLLSRWLGFEEAAGTVTLLETTGKLSVLVRGADGMIALLVDAVLDSRELILQGIGQLARRIRGVVGGALRTDGRPLFLVDVAELERASLGTQRMVASAALRKRQQIEKTRILVVDDALSVRRSMQQLLGDAGYEVALAADGFEAIEQVRKRQPALVLTDLEMPNLNGLELTKRIREVPQWMAIPVVMITSRAGERYQTLATDAGVDVYLTKPYQDADLLATVRALVSDEIMSVF